MVQDAPGKDARAEPCPRQHTRVRIGALSSPARRGGSGRGRWRCAFRLRRAANTAARAQCCVAARPVSGRSLRS
eukprot:7388706-Prymnesium_polylepis.2